MKLYLRLPKDRLGEISGLGLGDSKNSSMREGDRTHANSRTYTRLLGLELDSAAEILTLTLSPIH